MAERVTAEERDHRLYRQAQRFEGKALYPLGTRVIDEIRAAERAVWERAIEVVRSHDYFENKRASEVWTEPLVKALEAARDAE